jgi:hypothetical protein
MLATDGFWGSTARKTPCPGRYLFSERLHIGFSIGKMTSRKIVELSSMSVARRRSEHGAQRETIWVVECVTGEYHACLTKHLAKSVHMRLFRVSFQVKD